MNNVRRPSVAARIAALHKEPADKRQIMEAIADPSFRVKEAALRVLSEQELPPDLAASVIGLLQNRHRFIRSAAADVLGGCDSPSCVRALLAALSDPDEMVRVNAADSLGQIGDRRAIRPLIQLMNNDKAVLVRALAADALGNFRAHVVRVAIKAALRRERRAMVRIRMLFSLYRLGEESRLEELSRYLLAPGYRDRCAVANSIADARIVGRRRNAFRSMLREALAREPTVAARSSLTRALETLD
jgi:HEAT repeat protein